MMKAPKRLQTRKRSASRRMRKTEFSSIFFLYPLQVAFLGGKSFPELLPIPVKYRSNSIKQNYKTVPFNDILQYAGKDHFIFIFPLNRKWQSIAVAYEYFVILYLKTEFVASFC